VESIPAAADPCGRARNGASSRFRFRSGPARRGKNREIYLYRGADREKRILEGAKKEREVVVYTSLNLKDSVPIVEVFERKYGVKVQLWRSSSEKVLQRAVAEARAGRFSCDILETNGPEMEAMHREELLEEFFSPHFKDLPPAGLSQASPLRRRPLQFLHHRLQHQSRQGKRGTRQL